MMGPSSTTSLGKKAEGKKSTRITSKSLCKTLKDNILSLIVIRIKDNLDS